MLEYTYDAYGNIIDVSHLPGVDLSNINHIIYKSYYIDYENNLYYLKTRYYNPNWGRFISYDSVDYLNANVAGGLNLYAYCLNNPILLVYENSSVTITRRTTGIFLLSSNKKMTSAFQQNGGLLLSCHVVINVSDRTHYTHSLISNELFGNTIVNITFTVGESHENYGGRYSFVDRGNDTTYFGSGFPIGDSVKIELYQSKKTAGIDVILKNGVVYGVTISKDGTMGFKSGYSSDGIYSTMAIEGKQATGAIIIGVAGTVLASCFCGGGRYCCVKEFDNDNLLGAYYG